MRDYANECIGNNENICLGVDGKVYVDGCVSIGCIQDLYVDGGELGDLGVGSNGDLGVGSWKLEVGSNGDFYMNGSAENDVDFYMNVDMSIYGIQNLYVDGGGQYIEPPGLLSRIESPRHAFPKTNR